MLSDSPLLTQIPESVRYSVARVTFPRPRKESSFLERESEWVAAVFVGCALSAGVNAIGLWGSDLSRTEGASSELRSFFTVVNDGERDGWKDGNISGRKF